MLLEEVYCTEMIKTNFNKPMIMTEQDELDFTNAKYFHICNAKYKVKAETVRDHDHYTGKYNGSAHKNVI